jgi:hypothetical protein
MLQNYASHNPLLSQVAVEYLNSQDLAGLVGLRLIPGQNVEYLQGRYPVAGKEILSKRKPERIGPASESIVIRPDGFTYRDFAIEPYAARISVDELERIWASYSLPGIDLRTRGTQFLTVLIDVWFEETLWAAIKSDLIANGRSTTLDNTAGKEKWNNYTAGDPIQQVENVKSNFLRKPNVMVVNYPTFLSLRSHPKVIERVKYAQVAKPFSPEELAGLFDVEQFVVAFWRYYDPATGTFANLHSNDAYLMYLDRTVTPFSQTAYFYLWNGRSLIEVFQWVDPGTGAKAGTEWIKAELAVSTVQSAHPESAWVFVNTL